MSWNIYKSWIPPSVENFFFAPPSMWRSGIHACSYSTSTWSTRTRKTAWSIFPCSWTGICVLQFQNKRTLLKWQTNLSKRLLMSAYPFMGVLHRRFFRQKLQGCQIVAHFSQMIKDDQDCYVWCAIFFIHMLKTMQWQLDRDVKPRQNITSMWLWSPTALTSPSTRWMFLTPFQVLAPPRVHFWMHLATPLAESFSFWYTQYLVWLGAWRRCCHRLGIVRNMDILHASFSTSDLLEATSPLARVRSSRKCWQAWLILHVTSKFCMDSAISARSVSLVPSFKLADSLCLFFIPPSQCGPLVSVHFHGLISCQWLEDTV